MNIVPTLLIMGLATSAGFLAAAGPDLSKLPPPSEKTDVTYAKDIRPLFEASCFNCHGQQRQRGGMRLDSLEAALKGTKDGKVITPGNSKDSVLVVAVAQLDDETAMPPKRGGRGGGGGQGGRGPGGGGGGFGGGRGPGGGGGFGGGAAFGRQMLAQLMVSQADADKDQKLSKTEFSGLANTWFDKMDSAKSGKLSKEQFAEKLGEVLNLPKATGGAAPAAGADAASQRPGGAAAAGPTGYIGPGLFTAADTDKDGSLTRAELKGAFEKWFTEWDSEKSGALNEETLYAGLKAVLPQQGFGGFGGQGGGGGGRGQGGGGGFGGGGGGGPAPKPLTAEQVGLIRAWIDQGAK